MNKNVLRSSLGGLAFVLLLTCPVTTIQASEADDSLSSEGIQQSLLLDIPQDIPQENEEGTQSSHSDQAKDQDSSPNKEDKVDENTKDDKKVQPNPLHPTNPWSIRS